MKHILLSIVFFASVSQSAEISPSNYSLILKSLREFKDTKIETNLLEQSAIISAITDGTKSIKIVSINLFGSKKQINQALQDYSDNKNFGTKERAIALLALNYLRLSNPNFPVADESLSKKSEYTNNEF